MRLIETGEGFRESLTAPLGDGESQKRGCVMLIAFGRFLITFNGFVQLFILLVSASQIDKGVPLLDIRYDGRDGPVILHSVSKVTFDGIRDGLKPKPIPSRQ